MDVYWPRIVAARAAVIARDSSSASSSFRRKIAELVRRGTDTFTRKSSQVTSAQAQQTG
jgi:hypothetical protein